MWCPEGYVTLYDLSAPIDHLVDMFADSLRIDYGPPLNEGDTGYLSKEYFEDFRQLHNILTAQSERKIVNARIDGFHAWLVAKILHECSPRVASPDGNVMLTANVLYSHLADIHLAKWDRHFTDPFLYRHVLEAAFCENKYSMLEMFVAFNYPDGIILAPSSGVPSNFDVRLQEHFQGWAVCFRDTDVPRTTNDIMTLLELNALDFMMPGTHQRNPDEQLKYVYDCVIKAFPKGKGTTSWDDIQEKVGYSRRHIERAFKIFDANRRWALGGH